MGLIRDRINKHLANKKDLYNGNIGMRLVENKGLLDYRYIANKYLEYINTHGTVVSGRRLNALVFLTEVYYMQKHYKPLIKDDFKLYQVNSMMILFPIYYTYMDSKIDHNSIFIDGHPQGYVENIVYRNQYGNLVDEVNEIVATINSYTDHLYSKDLVTIIQRYDAPIRIKAPKHDRDRDLEETVSKQSIYQCYNNFDFDFLKQLNEESKSLTTTDKIM